MQPLDPVLSILQDNGGPTPTHALLTGSPAIDSGDNNVINIGSFFPDTPALDQRGSQRISNSIIDIGSYEVFVPTANPPVNDSGVNSENDSSSDSLFDTSIIRFQNITRQGTYLYVGEDEAQSVRTNFADIFIEEGEAFQVASTPSENDDLITIYRFASSEDPGTYLYVNAEERRDILQDYRSNFQEDGIAFYTYGADADQGVDIFRLQSIDNPGTYVFVQEAEKDLILRDFSNSFNLEGVAFEVVV